jgi:hypothetical protein
LPGFDSAHSPTQTELTRSRDAARPGRSVKARQIRYAAKAGWNPCTGWGTPNSTKLLLALQG